MIKGHTPQLAAIIESRLWFFLLAGAAVAVHLAGWHEPLSYQRQAVAAGEVWRLLTCHLAHLGNGHLLENLAGLLLVGWVSGDSFSQRQWAAITFLCALAIGAALYLGNPELEWYVGLSGLLYGLLIAGLLMQLRRHPSRRYALVLLSAVVLKILWEQQAGPLPGSERITGGSVIVDAHLYGVMFGVICALAFQAIHHSTDNR